MAATMLELAKLEEHLRTTMQYPNVTDLKLIYDNTLTASDVNGKQSRLSMSRNKVLTPFLTHSEDLFLQWKYADGSNTKIPLNVVVKSTEYKLTLSRWNYYDPDNNKHNIIIDDSNTNYNNTTTGNTNNTTTGNTDKNPSNNKRKRTNKNKQDDDDDAENNNKKEKIYGWKYELTGGWNQLKVDNHLQPGDPIQVVSFRSHNHDIGFVLLPKPAN